MLSVVAYSAKNVRALLSLVFVAPFSADALNHRIHWKGRVLGQAVWVGCEVAVINGFAFWVWLLCIDVYLVE